MLCRQSPTPGFCVLPAPHTSGWLSVVNKYFLKALESHKPAQMNPNAWNVEARQPAPRE